MAPSRVSTDRGSDDMPSNSSSESNTGSDSEIDFFGRPVKRRRISQESKDIGVATKSYNAPSRIQKAHRLDPEVLPPPPTPAIITTSASFDSLSVSPWLTISLSAMAVKRPTEIQKACIPEILRGRDCIGGSRTGTGKTIAFAVPILQKWAEDPFGIYALVLTPTRELALQIYEQFQALGAPQSLKTVLITGGSEMRPQAVALSQRPHVVVATPGRLADHIQTSGHDTVAGLSRAKVVVLDEADRLLSSGPGSMLPDVEVCLSALPPSTSRQTLLFTATVTPEVRALKSLPRPSSRPPIFISEITPSTARTPASLLPARLKQTYLRVPMTHKPAFLHALLQTPAISALPSLIIFVNRTSTADLLHRMLRTLGHNTTSLHSQLPQSQRSANLADFRARKARILVATDVAARGLDIPAVALVANYDVPRDPVDYVHRVGRTARADKAGLAVTFIGQRDVQCILAIEAYISGDNITSGTDDADADAEPKAAEEGESTTPVPAFRMEEYTEEGVNVETRVLRGRTLKDVAEARMGALRDVEAGKDLFGKRRKVALNRA